MHTDVNSFLDYIFETFIPYRMVISVFCLFTYEWQQMKNLENRGVLLPAERHTMESLLRALPSISSENRFIKYLVLGGAANSTANGDGDSFCREPLLEGMRQKCTAVKRYRKLSDTTVRGEDRRTYLK